MIIGALFLNIHLPGIRSLKRKRQIVKSMKEKLRTRYNISIAEVGALDSWQRAELGVVTVSNDRGRVEHVLAKVVDRVRGNPEMAIIDYSVDIF